jgi:7-carboxy-7-deazaguanine synthase
MTDLYHTQWIDINANPKSYFGQKADEVLVTSIFPTLQGEGPYAGMPCLFIRLAGCNRGEKTTMGCSFCDTQFLYHKGTRFKVGDLVTAAMAHNLVILTGGEPMLQYSLPTLIGALHHAGKTVQIESNGDRLVTGYHKEEATLVVSPKITPSTNSYKPLRKDVAENLDYLKFLIDVRKESGYSALPAWISDFPKDKIYLSPIAVYKRGVKAGEIASLWTDGLLDREPTSKNYAYAAELCMHMGYRLSTQQHLATAIE